MLVALGVVTLWLGSILSMLELSVAVLASLFAVLAVLEYGKSAPWLVYAATAILSLLLLPQKAPALAYTLFFGYYPIVKEKLERLPLLAAWLLKEGIFHVSLILLYGLYTYLLSPGAREPLWYLALILILAEVTFVLYDMALTRIITLYLFRWRDRFRFKK